MLRFRYGILPYLFVLPMISTSLSACPEHCLCDIQRHLVSCKNAGLHHVPWDLPDPMGLTHLDLGGNEISEINAQFVYTNLKFLDLSNNRIIHIADGILRDLRNLEDLVLKNNHLGEISDEVFAEMAQLRQLDLSSNELTRLDRPIFRHLSNLEDLNLAGNQLSNFSSSAFSGLENLHYLNIEDNLLTSIEDRGLFENLHSLKKLSLGYNRLTSIPVDAFSELKKIRELDLEDNMIANIDERAFTDVKPNPSSQLERLNLRNNKLITVPTPAFSYLANLESLDLSQNPIEKIHSGAFHGLQHLRKIQINAMQVLTSIENYAFSELAYLEDVQFYSNHKLESISDGAFLGTPELRRIDLHANGLSTLSINLLDWNKLEHLDLRYNQWHCDCHLAWLPHILRQLFGNHSEYLTQEIRCFSPPEFVRRAVIEITEDELRSDCAVKSQIATPGTKPQKFQDDVLIAIMCTVGGVLVVIIVILICKYGSSYRTAYAPAMDNYVYRSAKNNHDVENMRVPVIEGKKVQGLRSSLSSVSEIGNGRNERRLYRVRFSEASDP